MHWWLRAWHWWLPGFLQLHLLMQILLQSAGVLPAHPALGRAPSQPVCTFVSELCTVSHQPGVPGVTLSVPGEGRHRCDQVSCSPSTEHNYTPAMRTLEPQFCKHSLHAPDLGCESLQGWVWAHQPFSCTGCSAFWS